MSTSYHQMNQWYEERDAGDNCPVNDLLVSQHLLNGYKPLPHIPLCDIQKYKSLPYSFQTTQKSKHDKYERPSQRPMQNKAECVSETSLPVLMTSNYAVSRQYRRTKDTLFPFSLIDNHNNMFKPTNNSNRSFPPISDKDAIIPPISDKDAIYPPIKKKDVIFPPIRNKDTTENIHGHVSVVEIKRQYTKPPMRYVVTDGYPTRLPIKMSPRYGKLGNANSHFKYMSQKQTPGGWRHITQVTRYDGQRNTYLDGIPRLVENVSPMPPKQGGDISIDDNKVRRKNKKMSRNSRLFLED